MAYTARKINYCYVTVSHRAGSAAGILKALKKAGISLTAFSGFPAGGGRDEVGAIERPISRLAKANINVTAADAVAAGRGRYGMILWVKRRDYGRAAKAIGAR